MAQSCGTSTVAQRVLVEIRGSGSGHIAPGKAPAFFQINFLTGLCRHSQRQKEEG